MFEGGLKCPRFSKLKFNHPLRNHRWMGLLLKVVLEGIFDNSLPFNFFVIYREMKKYVLGKNIKKGKYKWMM